VKNVNMTMRFDYLMSNHNIISHSIHTSCNTSCQLFKLVQYILKKNGI